MLSTEWKEMTDDARAATKDQLRRELFKSDRNIFKDELVTTHQRERFVQEQADALSTMVGFYYTVWEVADQF